ncbi:MAG: type II secretion system F family protein [Planctomycetota bacterium]
MSARSAGKGIMAASTYSAANAWSDPSLHSANEASGGHDPSSTASLATLADRQAIDDATGRTQGAIARSTPRGSVLMALKQLSVMSSNGMEIADALEAVAETCPDPRLAADLDDILEAVGGGTMLSSAVQRHGSCFPRSLAPMLAAAEASGNVPETIQKASNRMRDEMQMRGTILGAMIYPLLLVGTSVVVLLALILGVLPQFAGVFESMGRDVPGPTAFLLSLGTCARRYWMIGVPVGIAMPIGLWCFRRHRWIVGPMATFWMRAPMVRGAYRSLQAGRNFRTIAAMVSGGVPFLTAVQMTRDVVVDPYWRGLLDDVEAALVDGRAASEAFFEVDFLPPEAASLLATAEKSGRVAETLEDVGSYYEEEAARQMKRLITMFEPLIILGMGVVVAGIVLSVMLPLMDVSTISG